MNTTTRKQREIQQRELRILDVSRAMLMEQGYHGLNMDRIAKELQYAKGTIYNHFPCKEEIIIALATQTIQRRAEMLQKAAAFRGKSRERLMALGVASELFFRLHPDHFFVEQIVRISSVSEKTSENRRNMMRSCESRCMGIVSGVVRDAVAHGDLDLPEGFAPEELVFALWSLTFGAYSIIASTEGLMDLGVHDPFAAMHANVDKMLDGFGWKPLSHAYDYRETERRILAEVFSDESAQLAN